VEGWHFAQQNDGVVSGKESSLMAGTIPVIWKKDAGQFPQESVDDFIDFLFDVEAKYWDEMYRFIKEEIKVKQPVSGTQIEYGSIIAQAKMDYCDYHAYWNHPIFPNRQWDMNDWYISNRALVNHLDREILGPVATKRVYGKPFTVSEYNHPAPNQYAAEGLPLLAAFGAFQDWDGFFPFAYSHSRDAEPKMITSFFDTSGNTAQMAHMIACKMLFDAEFNTPTSVAHLTAAKEREIYKRDRHQYNIGFSGLGLSPAIALTERTAIDVSGKVTEMLNVKTPNYKQSNWMIFSFDTDDYDAPLNGKPTAGGMFYKSDVGGSAWMYTPRAGMFTGFVEVRRRLYWIGGSKMSLQFNENPNLGWATATFARLDDEKSNTERYLFVITGEIRNTDMQVESLEGDRITVGNRWGKPPVLCEGVAVEMIWKDVKPGQLRCWALDESGNRREEVAVDGENIQLGPQYKTIWYEIEVTGPQS
jgi:hypothetical protein